MFVSGRMDRIDEVESSGQPNPLEFRVRRR